MAEKIKKKCLPEQQLPDLKKIYEKPQLGRVALFADQVLGGCRAPIVGTTCVIPNSAFS